MRREETRGERRAAAEGGEKRRDEGRAAAAAGEERRAQRPQREASEAHAARESRVQSESERRERLETCAQVSSARCALYIGSTGAILALRTELSEGLVTEKRASHQGAEHRLHI